MNRTCGAAHDGDNCAQKDSFEFDGSAFGIADAVNNMAMILMTTAVAGKQTLTTVIINSVHPYARLQ